VDGKETGSLEQRPPGRGNAEWTLVGAEWTPQAAVGAVKTRRRTVRSVTTTLLILNSVFDNQFSGQGMWLHGNAVPVEPGLPIAGVLLGSRRRVRI
jgi:hypothetical protein